MMKEIDEIAQAITKELSKHLAKYEMKVSYDKRSIDLTIKLEPVIHSINVAIKVKR